MIEFEWIFRYDTKTNTWNYYNFIRKSGLIPYQKLYIRELLNKEFDLKLLDYCKEKLNTLWKTAVIHFEIKEEYREEIDEFVLDTSKVSNIKVGHIK